MNLMRNWIGSSSSSDVRQKVQILKNNWDWLSARECDVRTELENAEIQPGKKRRREVDVWLRHVTVKRTEVESISSEVEGQEFLLSKSELNGRIERASEEIKDLLHHGTFLNGLTLDDFRGKSVPLVLTDLIGERFKVNVDRILWWLTNREAFVIGVYGMGGVGKTTLLMNIHNKLLSDSTIFGHVYWVTVSQECSLYRLQHKIAEVVGIDLSAETDEKKRAGILRGRLAILGSTVLFLDDMWKHFLIDEVGIPLEADTCKIILTSRSLEICRRMGCNNESIIKVDTLPENEAQKLFIDRVESYERLSVNVKQIAELVIDGCGGLPLAIITVACSMRGVFEIHEWQNALVEIQKASNWHDDMDNNILLKLKVSYDRLNDRNLQLCFLSCVLYPEDYPIWRETLIELWIMEGLLDEVENRHDQVNKGHSIINKLENVCLLQSVAGSELSDSDGCVGMHDLIRDMAIFITHDNPRFIVKAGMHLEEVPGEENWTEDLVKVSLTGNKIQEIPCQMSPRCSNLSVLFLQNNPLKKIPHAFFMHMTSLTLLDLSATGIETLPDSVSDLESLRLLMLRFCAELVYVPSLSKLTKLKVLNLYGTKIDEAPMGIEGLSYLEEISCGWKPSHLNAFNRYIECQQFRQLRYYGFWLREPGEDFEGPSRISNKEVVISGHVFKEGVLTPLLPYDIQYLQIDDCDITAGASLGSAIPSLCDAMELKNLHIRECKGLEYISSHSNSISLPSILTPLGTVEYLELFGLCGALWYIFSSQNVHNRKLFNNQEVISHQYGKTAAIPPISRIHQSQRM
ncbi:disease resistance protein At4g27190-like [Silene latifolia]|uniref:disease resistance protein At4g27190-like n=1 Tax=Silene latifolia TaxID=37657 RepID=UPI003D781833